jgi:ketopantoate reductase
MAELIDGHRPLMHALAAEVQQVALALGIRLEPFDAYEPSAYLPAADPRRREAATDALVDWLRGQSKDRSGIWRDIAVRHRPVEVHHHYRPVLAEAAARGVPVVLLPALLARLAEVEDGSRTMSPDNLAELTALVPSGEDR